jgi:putative PIN family toxin of toxin-antitoxin system
MAGAASVAPNLQIRPADPKAYCARKMVLTMGATFLCISEPILNEVGAVLRRPKIRAKFPSLTDELVSQFLQTVEGFSRLFIDVGSDLAFARDPKDARYINFAHRAKAQFPVTRDADLLDVPTASDGDSLRIREACPDLRIVGSARVPELGAAHIGSEIDRSPSDESSTDAGDRRPMRYLQPSHRQSCDGCGERAIGARIRTKPAAKQFRM